MKFITILLIFLSGSLITSIVTFSILLHNCKKSLNNCIKNNNQYNNQIDNQGINTTIDHYNYFNGMDISNKNNLLDEYKNNIILYSKNLNNCIKLCDSLENCNGFSKFENSCILKKNFSTNSIYYSPKINLYKKNKY